LRGRGMRWLFRLGVFALICAAVLGYGYWRVISRASVSLSVVEESSGGKEQPAPHAELTMRNAAHEVLAEGKSDARFGFVRFNHPQFGNCEEEEKSAYNSADSRARWDKCVAERFYWQARWAAHVRRLDVRFARCEIKDIALVLRPNRQEWWLWWVPLPHVGGDPLTDYNAKISINSSTCQARVLGRYE
jgi:hypothetical protein